MKLFQAKYEIWPLLLILALFLLGILFYPQLPGRVPSHWNLHGEVDGWSSPCFVAFLLPGIILGIYFVLSFIVYFDPFRKNIEKFYHIFWQLKFALVIFVSGLFGLTLIAALSQKKIPVDKIVIIGVSALIVFLGSLMPRIKRNFFIGIRLPWTLYSDKVWQKTHKIGKPTFMIMGLIIFLSVFMPSEVAFLIMLIAIFGGSFFLVAYSYLECRKLPESDKSKL